MSPGAFVVIGNTKVSHRTHLDCPRALGRSYSSLLPWPTLSMHHVARADSMDRTRFLQQKPQEKRHPPSLPFPFPGADLKEVVGSGIVRKTEDFALNKVQGLGGRG